MKIIHNSRKAEYREPFGAAKTGTKVSLTIKISDPAPESVRLMLWHGDDPAIHYQHSRCLTKAALSGMRSR